MPDQPDSPQPDTRGQTPADVNRMTPRVFAAGEPVPNREMWLLERRLGGGGFGEVWLARHEWKDEHVAVKFCTHPAARHRLITHEKKVVARVMKHGGHHPNVVPLLDCNLSGDTPWLIYEYVPGGTLADAMADWAALPPAERLARAVRVLHALAGALALFHRLDPPIAHRDLKPQNVLMAGDAPRITDFGLGGAVPAGASDSTGPYSGASAALPSMLRAAGTRAYAPPEQLFGSPPSPRDDVYALGVIAYQMARADLKAVPGTDAADELRDLNAPGELAALVVKSVAINPDRRPKDVSEWEGELAKLLPRPATPVAPAAERPGAQAVADYEQGQCHQNGWGVKRDFAKARACYEKAAARGHAAAQFNLGVLCAHGRGGPQDLAAARAWYEKAAAQGDAGATAYLAELYETGRGVAPDLPRALELYRQAAAQGNDYAKKALARLKDKK